MAIVVVLSIGVVSAQGTMERAFLGVSIFGSMSAQLVRRAALETAIATEMFGFFFHGIEVDSWETKTLFAKRGDIKKENKKNDWIRLAFQEGKNS